MPALMVQDDYKLLSRYVALKIAHLIKSKRMEGKRPVFGLATGSSPLGAYRELAKMHREGSVDFTESVFFNLDEYYGVRRNDLQSYHRFMRENFFEHVGARDDQVNIPDGTVDESEVIKYCAKYEAKIKAAGGIDLQVLGMGRNGHVGLNEPGSRPDSQTRLVTLSETTRRDAAPDFFGLKNVPSRAITMGVATILGAREIVMLVSGEHKATTLQRALEEPPSSDNPASYLRYHGSVEVLADRDAASKLTAHRTPWLVRSVDWKFEKTTAYSALIWLAQKRRKTIRELEPGDFRSELLQGMYRALGSSFAAEAQKEFDAKVNRLTRSLSGESADGSYNTKKKILIMSPHPDDDVVCMGATMKKLAMHGHDLNVAYMVSGSNAVKDLDVFNYLALRNESAARIVSEWADLQGIEYDDALETVIHSTYSKRKGEPDHYVVRQIKADIRRQEAERASARARARPHFLNLPFYEEYGSARKAPVSYEDVEVLKSFLTALRPDVVFVAGDSTDPNGTHSMCLTAFDDAMKQVEDSRDCPWWPPRMFQYRGAWEEFTIDEACSIEPFSEADMSAKIHMILEHVSQIEPLFPGPSDDREFWERARDRNQTSLSLARSLGISLGRDSVGAELYKDYSLPKN